MPKKKYDSSWFMNVEKIEDLKKLGSTPDPEEFRHGVMNIFKTPILLRTLARALEKDEKLIIKSLAKEVNERMIQILNEPDSPEDLSKSE